MKSRCFKVPFNKITEGPIGMSPTQQFKMEEQGSIIVYRSGNTLLAKKQWKYLANTISLI